MMVALEFIPRSRSVKWVRVAERRSNLSLQSYQSSLRDENPPLLHFRGFKATATLGWGVIGSAGQFLAADQYSSHRLFARAVRRPSMA